MTGFGKGLDDGTLSSELELARTRTMLKPLDLLLQQ